MLYILGMKTIGIDIDKKKVVVVAIETNSNCVYLSPETKYFELKDDRDGTELTAFMNQLHSYFDSISADKIGIVTRQTKGRFAASPYSFKLEGLIQLYAKTPIEFVTPQALTSHFKKNELPLSPSFSYQEKAMKLACYLAK